MIEFWQIHAIGMILLGMLIGGGIVDVYHNYKKGKTIFNKKKPKDTGKGNT